MAEVLGKVLNKIFGSASERYVKRTSDFVKRINELETEFEKLSDEQLRAKTDEFRAFMKEKTKQTFGRDLDLVLGELLEVPEERRKTLKKRIIDFKRGFGKWSHTPPKCNNLKPAVAFI